MTEAEAIKRAALARRDARRAGRKAERTKPVTINTSRLSRRDLEAGRRAYPETDHARPRTRGECARAARPCPFVSCRHHLYLDVMENGSIKVGHPHLELAEMPATCSLDVADDGPASLEEVAVALNLTRERVRQILEQILPRLRGRLEGWA